MNLTINRTELMTLAWRIARQEHWTRRLGPGELCPLFPAALKQAWATMKMKAAYRRKVLTEAGRPSSEIKYDIICLENKTTLGIDGLQRLSLLQRAHSEALEREAFEEKQADYAAKRELIASSGSRICSVTFTKKDGNERVMRVQPAAIQSHLKGADAAPAAFRAARTRQTNHPNLLPVFDAAKGAIRSINLDMVSRIAVAGQVYEYAA